MLELSDDNAIIVTSQDGSMDIINSQGKFLTSNNYCNIKIDDCNIIRAISHKGSGSSTVLFDYSGRSTSNKSFSEVYKFSDNVAWAILTKDDKKNYRKSLIDRNGNILFNLSYNFTKTVEFSEGLGWYAKQGSNRWNAIDKSGYVHFSIDAHSVYPFTLGLAPVYKGSLLILIKNGFC